MSTIVIKHTYAHSPSKVFAALNDFAAIHRFHPLVDSSPLVPGTPATGAGAERVCHFRDGNTLHERLVDAELDKRLSIEVVDTSMPVASMLARFELVPTPRGGTELTMSAVFELKMGILGKALDKLVVGRKFKRNLELLLSALDEHLSTGQDLPADWKAPPVTAQRQSVAN